MSVSHYVNIVKSKLGWKSPPRIYGEAAECFVEDNILCFRCGCLLNKCSQNTKLKDFDCSNPECGISYQVKAKKGKPSSYSLYHTNNILASAYQTRLKSIRNRDKIDWLIVYYNVENDAYTDVHWAKYETIRPCDLVPSRALGSHTRNPNYVGSKITLSDLSTQWSIYDDETCACGCGNVNDVQGWVQCDDCDDWYLQNCVGLSYSRSVMNPWTCQRCCDILS